MPRRSTSKSFGSMGTLGHSTRLYLGTGAQYSIALGRKFNDRRCKEGENVEAWVNGEQAQYRELKLLSFDLDALCVNVTPMAHPKDLRHWLIRAGQQVGFRTLRTFGPLY